MYMVLSQLTCRDRIRDIATCLNAMPNSLHHFGFSQHVDRPTLADTNEQRDWRTWKDLAKILTSKAKPLYWG